MGEGALFNDDAHYSQLILRYDIGKLPYCLFHPFDDLPSLNNSRLKSVEIYELLFS